MQAVHHHLVNTAQRTRIGIILETGEAREVHHHCCGYGADAVNPYAFEALWQARKTDFYQAEEYKTIDDLVAAYKKIAKAF